MAEDRLFDIDEIPEVPLFRPPRRSRGETDARFRNDYPPDWHRCQRCAGYGWLVNGGQPWYPKLDRDQLAPGLTSSSCPDCLGMGSLKARVRLEAGHRCVRCQHPYMPKGDAKMLGVEASDGHWSSCDERCTHPGPIRYRFGDEEWCDFGSLAEMIGWTNMPGLSEGRTMLAGTTAVEAEWRILTVHHLDGDKANCRWWNLAALCQRCHLEIQAKVMMERVYPHEHSSWFRPFAAGYYAYVYEGLEITREEAEDRLYELLAYERVV